MWPKGRQAPCSSSLRLLLAEQVFILCMAASCRKEDPAAWLQHQKRRWQEARSKRKRHKVDGDKGAGKRGAPPGHAQHQQQLSLQPRGV